MKTHIAIVINEYGGTAGLITIEYLLEEIDGKRISKIIMTISDSQN